MAIGTPTLVGSALGTNGSHQTIITTTAAVAANSLVVVGATACSSVAGIAISSISDGSNTYAADDSESYASTNVTERRSFYYTSTLGSGATITISWNQGAASGAAAGAVQVSGVTTNPQDLAADNEATNTSSTPSVTSNTLSTNNEIVFGVLGYKSAATYTENSPFTNLYNDLSNNSANLSIGYDIVAVNTAVTYAPSLGASRAWGALVGAYKGAAAAVAQFRTRMTMGAGR